MTFTDTDVKHYAAYIPGYTGADAAHLAAARAVLAGLEEEGRLLPPASRMATFIPAGEHHRSSRAVVWLEGPHDIFRFMVNLLSLQIDIGSAAQAVLVDLRDHTTPEHFDPMARTLLGDDRYEKLRDRFERDWSCRGCERDIRVGWKYAPLNDAGAACASCCKGHSEYTGRMVKRQPDRDLAAA